VNVATPVHRGGPYNWGKTLVEMLDSGGQRARHVHALKDVLSIPLYQDADILHAAIPLTFRLWRKPVVLTVHGEYPIERNVWRNFYPSAIRMSDAVTVPSRFLRDRLGLDDALVIPNAVFPERFMPVEHSEHSSINIVTVTKFAFRDKADSLIDLIRILDKARKTFDVPIDYTVIGGGTYFDEVKGKAGAYGLSVRYTGFVDSPKDYFRDMDIFAYYSIHDNFPTAILEAMASGLPVVTNNVGGVSEMIDHGKNGLIAGDDEEYREYIERLAGDPGLRARMGANARRKVDDRFNWHCVIGEYLKLYGALS
jgi:glycosyltransferase involved in cell wall biosynthesis